MEPKESVEWAREKWRAMPEKEREKLRADARDALAAQGMAGDERISNDYVDLYVVHALARHAANWRAWKEEFVVDPEEEHRN